jgi:hypothetical protein
MSIFSTLKADWAKFEGVVVRDEQAVRAKLVMVFGEANVDSAIANAEAAAETQLGKIVKDVVPFVETEFANVSGAVQSSVAGKIAIQIATALGIPFSQSAINHLIEIFVPFIAKAALSAVTAGL